MIYLSEDYLGKYIDVLAYLIGRSVNEEYSFDYIEKNIAYSNVISEFEKSNITTIAFSSMEKIYDSVFSSSDNDYVYNPYNIFGWAGYIYVHLFLHYEITFEALFYLLPIQKLIEKYKIYHEMDIQRMIDYCDERLHNSMLDIIMIKENISSQMLSKMTGISISTIKSIRYSIRDISKLESYKLLLLSQALKVKMESLLPNIHLQK